MNTGHILNVRDAIEMRPQTDNIMCGFAQYESTNCGTPSCVAGTAAYLAGCDPVKNPSSVFLSVAAEYLGFEIDSPEMNELCWPDEPTTGFSYTAYVGMAHYISKERVVACLTCLATTGKVDWRALEKGYS